MQTKESIIREVRVLANKAQKRAQPFESRGLYEPKLQNLKNAIDAIHQASGRKDMASASTFSVRKNYSTSSLLKIRAKLTTYLNTSPSYTHYARLAQQKYGTKTQKEATKMESEFQKARNYSSTRFESLGSDVPGAIYKAVREGRVNEEDVIKKVFEIASDVDRQTEEWYKAAGGSEWFRARLAKALDEFDIQI